MNTIANMLPKECYFEENWNLNIVSFDLWEEYSYLNT